VSTAPASRMTPGGALLAPAAEKMARRLLGRTGDRWRHTVAVAERAAELAEQLGLDTDVLEAAAWLHDIGYADAVVVTGFHPLDGARYLAGREWPQRIVGLVAQHSGARFVADERGLGAALAAYPDDAGRMSDALTYADQTVGPTGKRVSTVERRAEMLRRHGPQSWNARADPMRNTFLRAVATRVEHRLAHKPKRLEETFIRGG
jgi:putative nucleotidyltransferase with HDIG domain